jgi:DNA ligase (NAD+)
MTETLVEAGYDTLQKLQSMTIEQLVAINGIEIKTATTFIESIKSKKNIIINLLEAGITIKGKEKVMSKPIVAGGKFEGKVFVFTGKVEKIDEQGERYTRKRLQELVTQNGGSNSDSIDKTVTTLVQADPTSTSSKTVKANKLGVEIMSEADFFKILKI